MSRVSLDEVLAARQRIADGVAVTPCQYSAALSELCGAEVYCKLEFLQRTGSFKERGARNALLCLDEERRRRGVIAASAGNHALALAWHGRQLGVPATVVMPSFAPLIKQSNCRRLGANVVLHGETFAAAKAKADEIGASQGLTYIHGYDDPAIIAGQGTIALEILEQTPQIEALVVPIGGGGLMAGVAAVVRSLRPDVRLFGVEPAASACFSAAVEAGKPVSISSQSTLADGLAVGKAGANALETAGNDIERIVQVHESELALAVVRLMEHEKSVVEGAGAAPLAALLSGHLPELPGQRVGLILSGGNIDLTIVHRLIETAMVADGRLARFSVVISDRPGGLAKLCQAIAETGASVQEIVHDRAFSGPNVAAVNVLCTVETRDREHLRELCEALGRHGFNVRP